MTRKKPEVSERLDFDFYDRVRWMDKKHLSATDDYIILGKWIGISHKIRSDMCYWLLRVSGKVVARTTIQHVIHIDLIDTDMKQWIQKYEESEKRLDETNFL